MQTPTITAAPVRRVSYLDPTGHVYVAVRRLSERMKDINGSVAGLLDNGNDTSRFFFLGLAEVLERDYGVSKVILKTKPSSAKPASDAMLDDLAEQADFLVAGVAL